MKNFTQKEIEKLIAEDIADEGFFNIDYEYEDAEMKALEEENPLF